jgi:hypothetical protein
MGNLIQQGPQTDNSIVCAYGAEGLKNAPNELYVVNNTFVNDRQGGTFLEIASGATVAKVWNNLFTGSGTLISGRAADTAGNVVTQNPGFVNRAAYDYHITAASPAVNKGKAAGSGAGMALTPLFQYVHPVSREARVVVGAIDAGAYEAGSGNAVRPRTGSLNRPATSVSLRISAPGPDGWFVARAGDPEALLNSLGIRLPIP